MSLFALQLIGLQSAIAHTKPVTVIAKEIEEEYRRGGRKKVKGAGRLALTAPQTLLLSFKASRTAAETMVVVTLANVTSVTTTAASARHLLIVYQPTTMHTTWLDAVCFKMSSAAAAVCLMNKLLAECETATTEPGMIVHIAKLYWRHPEYMHIMFGVHIY